MSFIPFQSFKYIRTYYLITLSVSALMFVPTFSWTNETDKLALLEFKSLIIRDPFEVLSSWNQSSSFCNWVGVTCDQNQQRVTSLDLTHYNLLGTISPHIGNFSFLQSLNLGDNFFAGDIPPQVGHLHRLQYLNLSYNFLVGSIPVNLSHCSNLVSLDLGSNNLTDFIPSQLSFLSKLEILYLYTNSLTGRFLASLANLSSLLWLSVGENHLEGEIPFAIKRMKSLVGFLVGVNNFSGIILPSLYNLSNLKSISLTENNFSGELMSELGFSFPAIQVLDLGSNQFTGTLPEPLSNASNLQILDVGNNQLTGNIPMSYGKLKNLGWLSVGHNLLGSYGVDHNDLSFLTPLATCSNIYWLDFGYNRYGGVLPISIANLSTQMSWLTLGGNKISGVIPPEISNLIELTNLCVQDNLLIGNIPDSIGKLPKLTGLSFQINKLKGQIPLSICNLSRLSEFEVQSNYLEGRIPTCLANCQQLRILDLSHNKLNGTIPSRLVGLQSLSVILNMSNNFLSGSLPLEIEKLVFLVALDFSNNNLTGELQSETLGSCLALEKLYLQGNLFHGEVPNLNRLKYIRFLDLSRNNLSGRIPVYLAKSLSLENLNLSKNNFEGEVPEEGIFMNASAVELFGNNRLCGGMTELHLRACSVRKHRNNLSTKLIVLVVSLPLCLVFILFFMLCWNRRLKKPTLVNPIIDMPFHPKVSYEVLAKATNDFSPANCIGSGNFGDVYKGILILSQARDTTVAVKVLNLQTRGASKSFMAECEALRNIRHRNLVKILTTCSSIDFKALVYEFMPKGSLEKWLQQKDGTFAERALSLLERINIANDVASAIHYLHHQCQIPVIHCDIKPSNVLLDNDFNAHVSDFGLARLLLSTSKDNQLSSLGLKGTIGYAAPEYGTGEQVSTLGDVYSYGILLLEMFTGKRPTDEIFKDDMNLHNFVKRALLEKKMREIVDQSLLLDDITEQEACPSSSKSKEIDCLVSLLQVGIACSEYHPRDRTNMREISLALFSIKNDYLGTSGVHRATIEELI